MVHQALFPVLCLSLVVTSLGASLKFENRQVSNNVSSAPGAPNVHFFGVPDPNHKLYSFIDEFGNLAGFSIDLVKHVCKAAKQECFVIPVAPEDCLKTGLDITYGGQGMYGRWFDGCIHYELTKDLENVADFSLPILTTSSAFAVAKGNPKGFNPDSDVYSGFKIVHITGHSQNNQCLTRLSKKFDRLLIASDHEEAIRMVLDGEADVMFTSQYWALGLEVLDQRISCGDGYEGIIFPKGSVDKSWWDQAFQKFYFDGGYDKLCDYTEDKYGKRPRCIAAPENASPKLLETITNIPKPVDRNEKMFQFVVVGRSPNYSFINKEGVVQGFTKDLVQKVCKIAGKRCHLGLAEAHECTMRKGEMFYAGRGLLEAWFDGCTGYYDINERRVSWDFTAAYLTNYGAFNVAPGNPSGFDPKAEDYGNWTIAYKEAGETNDHCLNRLHKKYKNLLVVRGNREGENAVISGKADAYFGTRISSGKVSDQLVELPEKLHCDKVGTGIILRKGSTIPSWFDPAFDKLYMSGEYNRFCDEQTKYYGFDFPCLPRPETLKSSAKTAEEGF